MGCGCGKKTGGCVGPNCPPEQQIMGKTIVRMDLSPMAKNLTQDFPIEDLVRVMMKTIGPVRAVYGLETKRFLGRFQTGNLFLMPKVDYEAALARNKKSYELESVGFNPMGLPGIGEKLAQELRVSFGVFSKQDLINLGIEGLTKLHSTITEEKAQEILDILNGNPTKVAKKEVKPVNKEIKDKKEEIPVA